MSIEAGECRAALLDKCVSLVSDGSGKCFQDPALIGALDNISRLVKKLLETEGEAFLICEDDLNNVEAIFRRPGELLGKLVRGYVPNSKYFNEVYKFEPYLELAAKYIVMYDLPNALQRLKLSDPTVVVKVLNECVDKMRQESMSDSFLSRLKNYNRASNKNYKELLAYSDALFDRYSRLLVLRVDLSYLTQHPKIDQLEAMQHRKRLFENTRSNKLFADMVGYVWKLEHGSSKGFHFHVMFFFDGSKVREDGTIAQQIGKYWSNVITGGKGMYYNCNAVKHRYQSCGIGMISHGDYELRDGLRKAIVYLTKTDFYMKLQSVGRCMGKGSRPCKKDARGRPRRDVTPVESD